MGISDRYKSAEGAITRPAILRDLAIAVGGLILLHIVRPFYSGPTGSRGVITPFGRIIGIPAK